jgi:NCAIR mutase (PurE)-related protein
MFSEKENLRRILEDVKSAKLDIDTAMTQLVDPGYEDLGFAKVDHRRALRKGFPEVIYCSGKTAIQVAEIARSLRQRNDRVLATRASREAYEAVLSVAPEAIYHDTARIITITERPMTSIYTGYIAVLTGGTADLPVAEEAAITLEIMGHEARRIYDVGVAGIHRLLAQQSAIDAANVVIVVAGMEGALASVVAGLTDKPVIAVPTSTGYGASFGGIAPLLTMLNSCASGVSVCNIDNGFGAGYMAALINRLVAHGGQA